MSNEYVFNFWRQKKPRERAIRALLRVERQLKKKNETLREVEFFDEFREFVFVRTDSNLSNLVFSEFQVRNFDYLSTSSDELNDESKEELKEDLSFQHIRVAEALKYLKSLPHAKDEIVVAVLDGGANPKTNEIELWQNQHVNEYGCRNDVHGCRCLNGAMDGEIEELRSSDEFRQGHGHAISSVLSSRVGITPNLNISIAALKVKSDFYLGIRFFDILRCLEYAVKAKIRISVNPYAIRVNVSNLDQMEEEHQIHKRLFRLLERHGHIFVSSTGNWKESIDAVDRTHAVFPCEARLATVVLCTAGSSTRKKRVSISSYGKEKVDLAAPAYNVRVLDFLGRGELRWTGNSLTPPEVAGVCAYVWRGFPHFNSLQVLDSLRLGTHEATRKMWKTVTKYGHLDAAGALFEAERLNKTWTSFQTDERRKIPWFLFSFLLIFPFLFLLRRVYKNCSGNLKKKE